MKVVAIVRLQVLQLFNQVLILVKGRGLILKEHKGATTFPRQLQIFFKLRSLLRNLVEVILLLKKDERRWSLLGEYISLRARSLPLMCDSTRPALINLVNLIHRILILNLSNLELQFLIGVKGTDLLYLLFDGRVLDHMKQLDRKRCVNFSNRFIHYLLFIV